MPRTRRGSNSAPDDLDAMWKMWKLLREEKRAQTHKEVEPLHEPSPEVETQAAKPHTPPVEADIEHAIESAPLFSTNGDKVQEEQTVPSSSDMAEMVLFGVSKFHGKRPRLEIMDASNDADRLSSKLVKRCKWTDDAPASLLGREFTPNEAVTSLRDALAGRSLGKSGVNKNVALTITEDANAKPVLIKELIKNGTLRGQLLA